MQESKSRPRTADSRALPHDRFDQSAARDRVGVHRIVARPRRFWAYLVSALLGIALLTGAGIAAVMVADVNLDELFASTELPSTATSSSRPPVQAQLDPAAQVVVLNGTTEPGFGFIVDEAITANQWGDIIFSGDAASSDVTTTTVFHISVVDEAAALGLAAQLGGAKVQLAREYSVYGARLVVVLGADYAGPGSEFLVGAPVEAAEPEAAEPGVEELEQDEFAEAS